MSSPGWGDFWKDEKKSFHEVMALSTRYFALQLNKMFCFRPGDRILDYGCGPGFLERYFDERNVFVAGADINPAFVEQSRNDYPNFLFIEITTDLASNKEILDSQLGAGKFDYIILLSVVQYLNDVKEFERLIEMLLSFLKEKGRIIVADVIDENTSGFMDAASAFYYCIRNRGAMAFVKFMFYLLSSDYRKLSRRVKLLKVSEESVTEMAARLGIVCTKIRGLTLHPSRSTYILLKGHQ